MINRDECTFKVEALPSDVSLESLVAWGRGNPELDQVIRREVQEQLDSGNVWVWCDVRVTCTHPDLPTLEGVAWLSACSYPSEAEFKRNSGYYDDLCNDAFGYLCDEAGNMYRKLARLKEESEMDCEKDETR